MKCTVPVSTTLLLLLALFTSGSLRAQETIGLQIAGLTSAERDSIVLQHAGPDDFHVVFACVPAGLIVFRSGQQAGTRAALRSEVMQAIAPLVPPARISPAELTLQAAESACQAARGQ